MGEKHSQSIKSDRLSESSVARMAGNIAGFLVPPTAITYVMSEELIRQVAVKSVMLARAIAEELARTTPMSSERP